MIRRTSQAKGEWNLDRVDKDQHVIRCVDEKTWHVAQEYELDYALRRGGIKSCDDWNEWWFERFLRYRDIQDMAFENVLEVGCGPHTNLRFVLPLIEYERVFLEDPLIQSYIMCQLLPRGPIDGFADAILRVLRRRKAKYSYLIHMMTDLAGRLNISSASLEELPFRDSMMDLLVCINVLDHVRDYDLSVGEMNRVLKKGGILIIGQDLSNKEDMDCCPESYSDVGHPIKLDGPTLEKSLIGYDPVFSRTLARGEGRNPEAHYGTYLGILRKK